MYLLLFYWKKSISIHIYMYITLCTYIYVYEYNESMFLLKFLDVVVLRISFLFVLFCSLLLSVGLCFPSGDSSSSTRECWTEDDSEVCVRIKKEGDEALWPSSTAEYSQTRRASLLSYQRACDVAVSYVYMCLYIYIPIDISSSMQHSTIDLDLLG